MEIAREHDLPVVEDAACAIGSEICMDGQWQKIGRPLGDIVCFSFHPRKVMSTGDGGMLTTDNPELGCALPATAAARNERSGHGSTCLAAGHFRNTSRTSATITV